MKQIGIFFLFTMIIFSACKKNNSPAPPADASLVWYYTSDFVPPTTYAYMITNNRLFIDTMTGYATNFSFTYPVSDSAKYRLALPLLNNFPQYLANGAGGYVNDTLFPVGMGVLHLEYTRNGHTVTWNIPPDTLYVPTQIRAYIQQVNTVVSQL